MAKELKYAISYPFLSFSFTLQPPRRVQPIDYERELLTRKGDIKADTHPNLLLFPEQDVTVRGKNY